MQINVCLIVLKLCLTLLSTLFQLGYNCEWAVPRENQHCGLRIDPDQLKHAAQVNPDWHFSPPVDFLLQESFLYTCIPLRRNVSARISLRGLRRLIWVDALRIGHNVGFLAERLIFYKQQICCKRLCKVLEENMEICYKYISLIIEYSWKHFDEMKTNASPFFFHDDFSSLSAIHIISMYHSKLLKK